MLELHNTRLFVHVVEKGSFSEAARFLGVTPSSISRQISQLEAELGVRLFHRTTRKQSLTEAGETYLTHARRIVGDLDDAKRAVNRLAERPTGRLHVSAEADFALAFIEPVLPEFLDRYPDIQLRLSMSAAMVDLVESGIDVAIRMGHLDDSDYVARKIATSRSVICASPDYLKRYGAPANPGELATHNCLSFRTAPGRNIWRFQSTDGPKEVAIAGRLNVNSLVFLRNAALADLGVIMAPSWIVGEEIERDRLVRLLSDFPLDPPSTPIHAVFSSNRRLAPKVRVFVDYLAERIGAAAQPLTD